MATRFQLIFQTYWLLWATPLLFLCTSLINPLISRWRMASIHRQVILVSDQHPDC